ncbi:MAG: hypothetical protein SNJ29_08915 [Rikenellaceae bacterium]
MSKLLDNILISTKGLLAAVPCVGGVITSNHIELSDALINTFKYNWARYVGDSILFRPVVGTPFWHLQNEPFWKLISHSGTVITKENMPNAKYSVGSIRANIAYAEIDTELFALMQDEDARAQLRVLLISTYLNDTHLQKSEASQLMLSIGTLLLLVA